MNTLNLIYIHNIDASEFQWFDGSTTQLESLEIIANKLVNQDVIVILSANQVYLSKVDLPNTSFSQLQKAAPFALEEELAEDIEALHFAYGPIIKNQPVAVAVINKTLLNNLLLRLKEYGLFVQACYLAPLLLPFSENEYSCAIIENQVLVKISDNNGFTVPIEQLQKFLELQLQVNPILPETIQLYDFENIYSSISIMPAIPIHPIKKKPAEFFPMLATQIVNHQYGINLLQAEFKPKKKSDRTKKAWIIAGTAVAAWLITIALLNIFSYVYYSHKQQKLTQQVNALYMKIFPEATAVVSPKIQIERQLQKYQHAGSDNGFLALLEKLGPVLAKTDSVRIKNLIYQNHQIILNIQTDSFQGLQHFATQLNNTALAIRQTNAGNDGKWVIATFNVSLPGGNA